MRALCVVDDKWLRGALYDDRAGVGGRGLFAASRISRIGLPAIALLLMFSRCTVLLADAAAEKAAVELVKTTASNVQFHLDGTVRFLRFSGPTVTNESLVPVHHFPRLEYLAIVAPQFNDAGMLYLASRKNLDTLLLSGTGVTDVGVEVVAALPALQRLYLDETAVTDAGLERLRNVPTLKVLSLKRTGITSEGLAHLREMNVLESLFLDGTTVDDAGLKALAACTSLKTLHLNSSSVQGADLSGLGRLSALEELDLSNCAVDQLDVASLVKLPKLKTLNLFSVDRELPQIAELKQALPKLGVFGLRSQRSAETARIASGEEGQASVAPRIAELLEPADQRFSLADGGEVPHFQRHVIPLLSRLGCNGRACHGSFQGQGGFRLSMFGYDFQADHAALAKGEVPRVDVSEPAESLILLKPTGELSHGGGKRFASGAWEERLLTRWIAGGARSVEHDAPRFVRLEVAPSEIVFNSDAAEQQLRVVVLWSDGSREDVTPLTRFQSNDDAVATVLPDGLVKAIGAGDTHIVCIYDNGVHPVPVLKPLESRASNPYPPVRASTPIDELVNAKLRKLGIVPSEVCDDAEFLRRVSLDLSGTLPTPEEIRHFEADRSSSKRERRIDELLERPAYVTWWTQKLCDLTGCNAGYLGSTEMARISAQQWQGWIERRVRDNVGWDKIAAGIIQGASRKPGQTYAEYVAAQSAFTRNTRPDDFAALGNTLPHYWFRDNLAMPKSKALSFGYVFLGVRLDCAECHKHPFDQWSQQDFQRFTEFFTRIKTGVAPDAAESNRRMKEMLGVPEKLNTATLRRQSYLQIAAEGRPIPWNEVYVEGPGADPQPARLLGGAELDLSKYDDPRAPLTDWLFEPGNRYFATAFVNRIWASYFHAGIVNPPDDLNLANPPSNRPLLDYLRDGFIEQGYDMKWLHREIVQSGTYQRSCQSNSTNKHDTRNFSRAVIRRLPAEVIVDAVTQSTASDAFLQKIAATVPGRQIGYHPVSYQTRTLPHALLVFGKPLRTTNCDCERKSAPTLPQTLYLRNDHEIVQQLVRAEGWVAAVQSSREARPHEKLIEEAYLRTLSRQPQVDELQACLEHFREADSAPEALRDLLWALLNTSEFITNH